ncbi:hypothetical protein GCM10009664_30230 [Kitasatospora gansuensis]
MPSGIHLVGLGQHLGAVVDGGRDGGGGGVERKQQHGVKVKGCAGVGISYRAGTHGHDGPDGRTGPGTMGGQHERVRAWQEQTCHVLEWWSPV